MHERDFDFEPEELLDEIEHVDYAPMTPDWWNDLYTDGCGNTFSDADPGL